MAPPSLPGPALPAWVRKRDGRLEPFDDDKINRSLLAALESLGRPDAFVARELTDSILHFLAAEADAPVISSSDLAECIVKIVRELGHPELARAYAEHGAARTRPGKDSAPGQVPVPLGPTAEQLGQWLMAQEDPLALQALVTRTALRAYALTHLFSRNVQTALEQGLLRIGGLESPGELAAAVVRLPAIRQGSGRLTLIEMLRKARRYVAETLVLDCPELALASAEGRIAQTAGLLRELDFTAGLLGLRIHLNLGCQLVSEPHALAGPGSLFQGQELVESSERLHGFREALLQEFLDHPLSATSLDWHVSEADWADPEGRRRLLGLLRAALRGRPVRFVFDAPRRPVLLADGLDRATPGLLLSLTLDLASLRRRVGAPDSPEAFAQRAGSLMRLALSAAPQKRDFLRRRGTPDWPPFLLDRAGAALRLEGWPEVLADRPGSHAGDIAEGWRFRLRFYQAFLEELRQEAARLHIPVAVEDQSTCPAPAARPEAILGLARQMGQLHDLLGHGTWLVPVAEHLGRAGEPWIETFQAIRTGTGIRRVAFLSAEQVGRQLTVFGS